MARARPIVASAVGGITDVIEDGVTGTLVPPDDVPALSAALEMAHRKSDRSMRIGRAAAQCVRERYNWGAVVSEFEAVYDEAVGAASVTPERPASGGAR